MRGGGALDGAELSAAMASPRHGEEPTERFRVVALDDEPDALELLAGVLRDRPFAVRPFTEPSAALEAVESRPDEVDLVILDRRMPGADGLELLERLRASAPGVPCIMLTGDSRDSTVAAAVAAGAFHVLRKPIIDLEAAITMMTRACTFARLERRTQVLERAAEVTERFEQLVGSSRAMRELFATIARVALTDLGVLIRGESGTGKELVARAIHARSERSRGPFVALNCAAIPETLIDSELFGHVRGAYTGATMMRPGVFVEADGGTLFLDEVGEIGPAAQARLLRVLEDAEVRAIGGTGTRRIDVRVIAATHVDLEEAVEQGRFRADLFYRLDVIEVRLPSLKHRAEDVPLLASHLLEKHAARMRRSVPRMSPDLVEALIRHDWPGNVRELENVLLRMLALCDDGELVAAMLPAALVAGPAPAASARAEPVRPRAAVPEEDVSWSDALGYREARRLALERFERSYFARALERSGGNLSEAARLADVDRSNLRRSLARLGLRPTGEGDGSGERD